MSKQHTEEQGGRFWSDAIRGLTPYVPGEQPARQDLVKLNTNENPYPPSPKVLEAIRAATGASLRLYPDPTGLALRQTIARRFELEPENVFLGNGSDEVLAHAFLGLLRQRLPILFPDVSYSFYPVYCGLYGISYEQVPLDAQLRVPVAAFSRPNGGIVLPNPNAPTGVALSLEQMRELLLANPDSVVVIDEAYVDFGAQSVVQLVPQFPNLLVVQTLSKSRSLAGLRVGFAIGQRGLIQALTLVKDSFNSYPLDRLALAGAQAALEDDDYLRQTASSIVASRTWLTDALMQRGFQVLPSLANFILVRHPEHDALALLAHWRAHGVLVRHLSHPRIQQYLRISIGTRAECEKLVAALLALKAKP